VTTFIAVSNRRGGVGKTTVTMMLAYGLSVARRQKVLVIDLDAQASTSIVLMGHERWRAAREANHTTCGLLTQIAHNQSIKYGEFIAREIGEVKLPDGRKPTLDLIPSAHDLDDKEALMMIAQQAFHHKISDAFVQMQERNCPSSCGEPCARPISSSSPMFPTGRLRTMSAGLPSG
jgi:cellulose biosynthesis protein BcsQ